MDNKQLQAILPAFGESIESHLYRYLTANKIATSKEVLFMAGSPAAGKTELLNRLIELNGLTNLVRIDADDFRWWFPYYNERNSRDYQRPASGMVEKTYTHALTDGYPIVMDSTFASSGIADKNFNRAFKAGYKVMLNYVYFEPALAWQYAQARTRQVPLDVLKKNFIKSRETIEYVLNKYHGCFTLNVFQRCPDPDNQGQFIIDYKPGVTKDTWLNSHDCPYTAIEDLAHIGV